LLLINFGSSITIPVVLSQIAVLNKAIEEKKKNLKIGKNPSVR